MRRSIAQVIDEMDDCHDVLRDPAVAANYTELLQRIKLTQQGQESRSSTRAAPTLRTAENMAREFHSEKLIHVCELANDLGPQKMLDNSSEVAVIPSLSPFQSDNTWSGLRPMALVKASIS